jgi:hypothetical protein
VIGGCAGTLARRRNWPYLNVMAQPISAPQEMPSALRPARGVARAVVVGGTALGAVLLAASLGLWFHYGTAVFFETIVSGIAGCF